ncbi:unnamed protein product [Tuber aestivum]|uniref:Uncharacterized protein n=1 Tax=Tuber aestivum TaxID=59557 RepID=A0A292PR05_9PEZI|nr:unnamed protein product [Tuber aestivum]
MPPCQSIRLLHESCRVLARFLRPLKGELLAKRGSDKVNRYTKSFCRGTPFLLLFLRSILDGPELAERSAEPRRHGRPVTDREVSFIFVLLEKISASRGYDCT